MESKELMELTRNLLNEVKEFGLEAEILVWSLRAMKADPTLEIEEALMEGYEEWIN